MSSLKQEGFAGSLRYLALGLSILVFLYLVLLPLYPLVNYRLTRSAERSFDNQTPESVNQAVSTSTTASSTARLPIISPKDNNPDRIIIKKIGVDAPIVVTNDEKYGLNHGAWLMPQGSTPEQGGNTVITGHRFKYLPPNNLTFYLLDKLVKGDEIEVDWRGKEYRYLVDSTKIVSASEISILASSSQPILTVFTCDPIFSTKNRLVVLAKPQ
jgi:LPXTG-site transpeptidase (sortase) family protein